MSQEIPELVAAIAEKAIRLDYRLATAESCTGGAIATALTEIAGSSAWFEGGIVSYSNQLKQNLLGVSLKSLDVYGAVSEQVAIEMVEGVIQNTATQAAVSVTGIAGPSGGSKDKPVGTVWIAWKINNQPPEAKKFSFSGSRFEVRKETVIEAIKGLLSRL